MPAKPSTAFYYVSFFILSMVKGRITRDCMARSKGVGIVSIVLQRSNMRMIYTLRSRQLPIALVYCAKQFVASAAWGPTSALLNFNQKQPPQISNIQLLTRTPPLIPPNPNTSYRRPSLVCVGSTTMPQEVSDIKQFIEICRRKDASCTSCLFSPLLFLLHRVDTVEEDGKRAIREHEEKARLTTQAQTAARIKRNRKSQQIKFKVRCHRYLYTLVLKDSDKADKLKQSLPPG